MHYFVTRVKWYARQLLPLKYHSNYFNQDKTKEFVSVWRMWLGRVYDHKHWQVVSDSGAKAA